MVLGLRGNAGPKRLLFVCPRICLYRGSHPSEEHFSTVSWLLFLFIVVLRAHRPIARWEEQWELTGYVPLLRYFITYCNPLKSLREDFTLRNNTHL